jgi:hypothetical protein
VITQIMILCHCKFRQKLPNIRVPNMTTIYRPGKRVWRTGSILDGKRLGTVHVLTEEKLKIGAGLQTSPRKPVVWLALQMNMSASLAWTVTKLMHLTVQNHCGSQTSWQFMKQKWVLPARHCNSSQFN